MAMDLRSQFALLIDPADEIGVKQMGRPDLCNVNVSTHFCGTIRVIGFSSMKAVSKQLKGGSDLLLKHQKLPIGNFKILIER